MKISKVSEVVTSIILSLAIIFSGIGVMTVTVDASTSVRSSYATFDTNKTYYIWLKDEPDNTDAPLKEIRRSIFRWNINGDGTGHNAVVHLDYQYGENCTMEFRDVGDGYYGIHYNNKKNSYWIDTKGDNTETGEVLHQNSDLEYDKDKKNIQNIISISNSFPYRAKKTHIIYIAEKPIFM